MIENIIFAILGIGQNPVYEYAPQDGVETIVPRIYERKLEYKNVEKIGGLSENIFIKRLEELKQGRKKIEGIPVDAVIPKKKNYVPEPLEKDVKRKYGGKNDFYKNPNLENKEFYKKTNRFHGLGRK